MELMYPHKIDRYRIIQNVFRTQRSLYGSGTPQRGISQAALAERVKISQTTISNIENLEKSLSFPKRHVSREDLLKVLTWGLELEQGKIDAVLWLYDEELLREDEIRRYMRGYLPNARPQDYTYEELRKLFLGLIQDVINHRSPPGVAQRVTVNNIIHADEEGMLNSDRELLRLESQPGQRLMVTELPSHLTYPPEVYESEELLNQYLSDSQRMESREYSKQRAEQFLRNIDLYGERSIHSMPHIVEYLKDSPSHKRRYRLNILEQRQKHVEYWCDLLKNRRYYDIRLAEMTPDIEIEIKSSVEVMVRPAYRYEMYETENDRPMWGPRYIQWFDEVSVLRFLLDFEEQWDRLSKEQDKEWVVRFLENKLLESRKL